MSRSPFRLLAALRPGGRSLLGQAHHDAVGHAQVHRDDVLLQNLALPLQPHQPGKRLGGVGLGQADVDAVELERPAPAGDVGAGADARSERTGRLDQREIFLEALVGARADDERQVDVALVAQVIDHLAVGGDHLDLAVLLPERGGLALDLIDDDLVGVELPHGGAGDQLLGEQSVAHAIDVEERHGGAPVDTGGAQHLALVHPRQAGDGHPLDAEAGDPREDVERPAILGDEAIVAPAHDEAGQRDRAGKPGDQRRAREPRHACLDRYRRPEPTCRREPPEDLREPQPRKDPAAAGVTGCVQRLREASSTIHRTSSPKLWPAWAAISGTRLVWVIPGCVLTSRTTRAPVPPGVSS